MLEPYYQDDSCTIYHGDCLDILDSGRLENVDLVLTDPPYNVGVEYGNATNDRRLDYSAWCREWFAACMEVSQSVAISPGIANMPMWFGIQEPTWTLAWHKPAAMGRCVVGFCNWEPVLLYGKKRGPAHTDIFTATIRPDASLGDHPCPKPVEWAEQLLTRLSFPGDVILDPFAGSGTTLLAAKRLGRCAVGIEVEERYCYLAAERLDAERSIFDALPKPRLAQEVLPLEVS